MADDRTTVRSPRKPRGGKIRTPRLRVTAGATAGATFELDEGEWVVGKGDDARIQLTDSGVSRRHAKIVRSSDGVVVIIDLQSTNGTYVNDARVETAQLREGFVVGIGPDAELRFEYADDDPAPVEPKPRPAATPLTKRELEIARLVAKGLTNPQVAERIGVKARTVSSHLDNMYAKLRISSRAALTRYVIENRLDSDE